VAKKSQFTYENQAKLSVGLAGVGALAVVAPLVLIGVNFRSAMAAGVYSPEGKWILAFVAALLGAMLATGVGLIIGFNSAGQKRNTKPRLSWIGFFVNAAVLTLALVAALAFFFMRMPLTK